MSSPDLHYGMIGESPAMYKVYESIERVASSGVTVYIAGESGTGKELVARALHEQGARREARFAGVSVAELGDGDLLEAHLFGVAHRVATGVAKREGLFIQANGGTLFLDEIAEMSPRVQAKLLRALQERAVVAVGGDYTQPTSFDVRFVAASSRPLESYVQENTFRSDLYYRLRQVYIFLPPLRERGEDIKHLTDHFLAKSNELEQKDVTFCSGVYSWLMTQLWPGNVRELENAVHGAVAWTQKKVLEPKDFLLYQKTGSPVLVPKNYGPFVESIPPTMSMQDIRLRLGEIQNGILAQILQARFDLNDGNVSRTSKSLGLDRANFRRLARDAGLNLIAKGTDEQ